MRFALEHWWFLLGHLGFAATQTALLPIVINNIIIINKIPQCSDIRCHLTSCRAAGVFGRFGWDLEDSLPQTHQWGEHISTRQHPALWSTEAAVAPQTSFFCVLRNALGASLEGSSRQPSCWGQIPHSPYQGTRNN